MRRVAARRFPWYGWVGAGGLVGGAAALGAGIYLVELHFYLVAWWSYILFADAVVAWRRGHSLLADRPWELGVLAVWSVPIWSLFELLNFRLQNWFYVNTPASPLHGALMTALAYATVLPGLFETYDLLAAFRVLEGARVRPWRITPAGRTVSVAAGLGMMGASLAWPELAFPLVWLFLIFLGDPLCHVGGARSLAGQLERGDPRPALRLLAAGLVCGALWELWNFWAHARWIYTVPFLEETKWFEMPPLGFLGFPPFALECYVLANILRVGRRGRGWEGPEDARRAGAPPARAAVALAAAAAFSLAVYVGTDRLTVESRSPLLADMDGVPREVVDRLAGAGITRPHALARRSRSPARLAALAADSGIDPAELGRVAGAARLVDTKGLGAAHFNTLSALGIRTVCDLGAQDPVALHRRWAVAGASRPPRPAQVRMWVQAARARAESTSGPDRDCSAGGGRAR